MRVKFSVGGLLRNLGTVRGAALGGDGSPGEEQDIVWEEREEREV